MCKCMILYLNKTLRTKILEFFCKYVDLHHILSYFRVISYPSFNNFQLPSSTLGLQSLDGNWYECLFVSINDAGRVYDAIWTAQSISNKSFSNCHDYICNVLFTGVVFSIRLTVESSPWQRITSLRFSFCWIPSCLKQLRTPLQLVFLLQHRWPPLAVRPRSQPTHLLRHPSRHLHLQQKHVTW